VDVDDAVERLWPDRGVRVTPLGGGITNHNFKVEVDDQVFVLRISGAQTRILGIDREVEHQASLRAAELGIGPPVAAFIADRGWLVTRFIDGAPISSEAMKQPELVRRVATTLKKFHDSPPIPGRFDSFAVVEQYRRDSESRGVVVPEAYTAAEEIADKIRADRGPQPEVPCHNDLLNANFIDDGAIRIVDWEYAGMGDRFFDLANFSVNQEFGEAEDVELLTAYFGDAAAYRLRDLRMMKVMSDLREAMWGVLQSGISELEFDFKGYATKHFDRLAANASALRIV
jgi:thiamine kinase-like enzyme